MNCQRRAIISAEPWPGDVPVPTFGPRGGAREPDGRSMAVILHAAASQVEDYFGQATAPTNVSLSGPTTCDGVGVAGDFGRGSEIFWRTSCSAGCFSTSGEGATTAVGAITPEACASGAGASQPNCSDQFATISLAALPYDCHPDVAATPRQNAITKPKVRPCDRGLLDIRAFSRSR